MRAPALALAAVWLLATTLGPTSLDQPSDLPVYRSYAMALEAGLLPYRDFAVEYPPLALLPILLAGLPGTGETAYAWGFGALMLAAALAAQREVARLAGPHARGAAWLMAALPIAAGAIVRTRFDLVPIALVLAALAALAVRGRPALGFVLLALGAATKLFPAVVAAAAFVWLRHAGRRREAREGAALFAAVLLLVCLPFLLLSPSGFADQLTFHLERPVQIESAPATVLWALGDSFVTGGTLRPDRFKSNGLDGGPAGLVAALFAVLQLAAVLAAVALAGVGPRADPRRLFLASFAALVAFVALGKVLSPQFLLWLAPLAVVALALGDRAPALLVLAALPLTQIGFPAGYAGLVAGDAEVVVLVGVRNALLLAALSLLLARLAAPLRSTRPAAAAARSG